MEEVKYLGIFVAIGFIYILYFCYSHAKLYGGKTQFFICFLKSKYTKTWIAFLIFWVLSLVLSYLDVPGLVIELSAIPFGIYILPTLDSKDTIQRKDTAIHKILSEIETVQREIVYAQSYLDFKDIERDRNGYLSDEDKMTIEKTKKEIEQNKITLYDLQVKLEKEKRRDLQFYNEKSGKG